jgi:sugar transferase (PEP-CTERM system associated)
MIRVFRVFISKVIIALLVGDILLLFACLIGGLYLTQDPTLAWLYLFEEDGLRNVGIAVLSMVLSLYFQNMYSDFTQQSRLEYLQQVTVAVGMMLLTQALVAYFSHTLMLPRWGVLAGSLLLLVVFPLWRSACLGLLRTTLGLRKVLFVGTDPSGLAIADSIVSRPHLGVQTVGFLDNALPVGHQLGGACVLGTFNDIRRVVTDTCPHEIVVNVTERRSILPVDLLLDLRFSGIRIVEAGTLHEVISGRVLVRSLRPSQLIFSSELGPSRRMMQLQNIYSFAIALVSLILAAPVMLLVALAVQLTSPGPVLFRQKRVGLNGKLFNIYKFRSMVVDAEAATGAVWAKKNDPRVTPLGAFLRKTRLDELPQVFNVLRSEMSIVGPRPERPEFVTVLSEQIPFYRQRHVVKPGVTGWAQINYKYGESIEDTIVKLEYDLYYIKNLSPSLDLYIILDTLKVMLFSGHGQ